MTFVHFVITTSMILCLRFCEKSMDEEAHSEEQKGYLNVVPPSTTSV